MKGSIDAPLESEWVAKGLLLLVILTLVLLVATHSHPWITIALLLAIIFYALFHNPMRHVAPPVKEKPSSRGAKWKRTR